MRKKEMIFFWFQLAMLVMLSNACDNPKTSRGIPAGYTFAEETGLLKKMVEGRLPLLYKTDLNSLKIESDTLYVFITDSSVNYLNPVLVRHNLGVLFQDYPSIDSAPFGGIKISYQFPRTGELGYKIVYLGSLESLKSTLHMFTNLSFKKVVNQVALLSKEYPDNHIVERLNRVLHWELIDHGEGTYSKEETDYLDTLTIYLLECEKRKPGFASKVFKNSVKVFKENVEEAFIGIELSEIFEGNCKEIQELNPEKRNEKQKPIFL